MSKATKMHVVTIRLPHAEARRLEQLAGEMGMSRSELVRAMLSGDASPSTPTSAGGDAMDAIKVELRDRMVELRSEITAAFDELLKKLSELIAIPSFTEFRARMIAQGIKNRPGESTLDYVVRIAQAYYAAYGIWPNPDDHDRFGRMDEGDRARFPRHPPK